MVDTVVISQAPQADDPAHIDAMVKKVDDANAAALAGESHVSASKDEAPARPSWLPEKFGSAEDLAKAYAELEARQGSKSAETPVPAEATPTEAAKVLSDKGLDFNAFSDEFTRDGALSDNSYGKLEAAGLPRAVVDQYIAGQRALADHYTTEVQAATGGVEGFAEMSRWAQANATQDELKAYNDAIDSGDVSRAKLAAAGLYQKFLSSGHGAEPNLLTGSGKATSLDQYESVAQLQKDMASSEYKTDPAFRKKVQDKLGRSSIL